MAFAEEMAEYRAGVKLYQVWPGKNRFCFSGRCMTGPWSDCGPNTCVWTIILVPVTVFYVALGKELWFKFPSLFITTTVAFSWTMVALVLTGWSDPGIIPRQTRAQAWQQAKELEGSLGGDSSDSKHAQLPKSLVVDNNEGGRDVWKFCRTCNIYRPPRASHCEDCDNCVKEFDHHCPFVGNCVGERNYGPFCAFLICVVALLMSVLISAVMGTSEIKGDNAQVNTVMIFVVAGYSLLMFFVIGGFSGFHLFLIHTGQTTKQKMKGTGDGKARTVSCLNRPPSLFDARRLVHNQAPEGENVKLLVTGGDDSAHD